MSDLNVLIKKSFGEKFKQARNIAGYSRAKLGVEINVSAKTIQSWEVGRTFPENMALIPIIREKLGFFIPKILGDTVIEEEKKLAGKDESEKKVIRRAAVVEEDSKEENVE
jgi:DNA-binding XRE family transcriptional regulator